MRVLVLDYVKELVQAHVLDVLAPAQVVEVVTQVAEVVLVHAAEIVNQDVKDVPLHVQVLAAPLVEATVPVVVPVVLVALPAVQTLA